MPTAFDRFIAAARHARGSLFGDGPLVVARAPGWVDLMGGAAAPGGSLALGWPLGQGAFAALQPLRQRGLLVHTSPEQGYALNLVELEHADGAPREYADAASRLAQLPLAARVAGAVWLALMREEFARFPGGASLLVRPAEGPGATVALATAMAQAVVTAFDVRLPARELAYVVETALEQVAGQRPGALGTLVAACAHGGSLLPVHQQPRWLWDGLHMPPHTALWAVTLGDGPAIAAAEQARAATAMAYALAAEAAGMGRGEADGHWLGYLANLGTPFFEARVRGQLPATLTGAAFLARHGPVAGLRIEPDHEYQVRAAAALAVEEHLRSRMVAALLRAAASKAQRDEDLALAGELMARSHGGQRAAGLSDAQADALVEQIYALGRGRGLYGARAAAAASGAALVVLGHADAEPALREIVAAYARSTGLPAAIFGGTSSGAQAAGARTVEG